MDASFFIKKPKYINKPFNRLSLKKRAVFILTLAGFTQRELARLFGTGLGTINRWVKEGYEEYEVKNGTNLPLMRRE